MASSSNSAESIVQTGRLAFLTSVTFRNEKWKLRQLHGLHQLLLDFREDLLRALTEDFAIPRDAYETELAIVLSDIASHYLNTQNSPISSRQKTLHRSRFSCLPTGVSLILSKSSDPLRYGLAPLAASISAGNSVVLATESTNSHIFSLLSEKIHQYLDSETIHIVQGLGLQDPVFAKVDHLFVLDEDTSRYRNLLRKENAHFQSTVPGFSLAVVDNGHTMVQRTAEEVLRSYTTSQSLTPERLAAVFIRKEDNAAFATAVSRFAKQALGSATDAKELIKLGFQPWVAGAYGCELLQLLQSPADQKHALSSALHAARKSNVLLILFYTSFEQVMDALSALEMLPLQIALLSPESKSTTLYLEKWTRSKVFSIGTVRSVIPVCSAPGPLSVDYSETLFPAMLFGELRISTLGTKQELPSITTALLDNKYIVKAIASDPNQTMEFFGYMSRVLTCVGVVLSCCAVGGAWLRWFR